MRVLIVRLQKKIEKLILACLRVSVKSEGGLK